MILKPIKSWRWPRDERIETAIARVQDGLFIHCEVVQPPSTKGRKATLWIEPEVADAMLRELRDYGIARRKATITAES